MNPSTESEAPAIRLVSLGCPKALVDSEQLLTGLRQQGWRGV